MNYAALTPIAKISATAEDKPQTKFLELDVLDTLKAADVITKRLGFMVKCAIKQGRTEFSAQLKGGKRFFCAPVMPEAADENTVAPKHGQNGYLTLALSENTKLLMTGGGYEFTLRPEFIKFEPVGDREQI